MVEKTYTITFRGELTKALSKTKRELKEDFIIKSVTYDDTTKKFTFIIEASDSFHSKLASYL